MPIIPTLDPREDRPACLVSGLEVIAIQHLTLERREHAFGHSVVKAIADTAHGRAHPELRATLAEGDRSVFPGFNWSSQRCLRSHLTSNIFTAMQSDADASEGGARCGARSWLSLSTQDLVERFGWRSPAERLSGSAVEGDSNCVELSRGVSTDVRTLGKVLPQQPVGVFIATSLPRA